MDRIRILFTFNRIVTTPLFSFRFGRGETSHKLPISNTPAMRWRWVFTIGRHFIYLLKYEMEEIC